MRARGWRPGWDGHLLLFHDEEAQRRAGVAAWVRRGLELGSKILYTQAPDEVPDRSLPGLLRDDPDALEAMDRGQIQGVPADPSTYELAFIRTAVEEALSDGYPSVRWSGDASTAWGVMSRSDHALLEQATDELCASLPLSVLCQYSTAERRGAIGFLGRSHGAGLQGQAFQAALVEDGLALAGELDGTNQATLRSVLTAATAAPVPEPFTLDLSRVDFLDLPAARALLFGTLDHRNAGGHVRLASPQPQVAQLLHLLGIDGEAGIRVGETP